MSTQSTRTATLADAPELARLLTLLGHDMAVGELEARWPDWAAAGNSALVAPGEQGGLLGVAVLHRMHVLHRPRPVGRITALIVDPSARGREVGRVLVEAGEAALEEAGCGLLEITSNVRLVEAHAFYEHLGYERSSVRFSRDLVEH
jgi:GNAT superfamily N-acetyltransferase